MPTKNKEKRITLRAFQINNSRIDKTTSDFYKILKDKLIISSNSGSRAMPANHNEKNGERDLISFYNFIDNPTAIFCLIMRIAPGDNHEAFSEKILDKKTFTLEDIKTNSNSANSITCLDSYYFLLQSDVLITNLPSNQTIKNLQTYLNWFTSNTLVEFTPIIETQNIKLSEVKQITIGDEAINITLRKNQDQETSSHSTIVSTIITLKNLGIEQIRNILQDAKSLEEINIDEFIDVDLTIKFKKPRKMTKEDYQNKFGAMLKPVSDLQNFTFKDKHGKIIAHGDKISKHKEVMIPMTKNNNLNEIKLMQDMSKYATEINNEKSTS